MDLIALKYLSATVVFLMTCLPGYHLFQTCPHDSHISPLQQAIARGIFFGLALLHMMPEALGPIAYHGYPWPMLACAVFFILLLWLEHLEKDRQSLPLIATATISIHAVLMGSALGLSHDMIAAWTTLAAIVLHKCQESYALAAILKRHHHGKFYFLLFATMTPMGILSGAWLADAMQNAPLLFQTLKGASAGSLLYLGTLHGFLSEDGKPTGCCKIRQFSGFVGGFLLMALLNAC
jgi:zinc transporter ZupT